ncbi:hypothetical protein IWQ60_012070 [Tieghemiomyces parasiticus]|uniref:Pseudouridine synthase RsuA/RluA-like domain-containing protein n=1 Tax=Tieghemiomyces parasiticus TaxID=78921 RepID=A0A9W8DL35_9FUNG|nr:hypothetical protein IWQ60_012070 [Tieghemiomyces parasiticus]
MRNDKVFTFVRLEPLTGRKHQLRVHCADVLGIAIVNDPKYARCAPERLLQPRAKDGSHMCLHLAYLRFPVMNRQGNAHPDEKQEASVIAPMPLHLAKFANGIALDKLLPEHVLGEISKKRPKFVSEEARVAKDQANEEEGEKVEETPTDGEEASKTTKDDRKVKPYVTPFLRGLSKPRYFDDWA